MQRHKKCHRIPVFLAMIVGVFLIGNPSPAASAEKAAPSSLDAATIPYRIGPNDLLYIYVWKEEELTQEITVMPDGRISFPLIGEVTAQGKTVTELMKDLTGRLKEFVTVPNVAVIVRESRSRRIYTIGKVANPGPYVLVPSMTVLQALSTAGGFAEWADEKGILIIRRAGGEEIQIRFNYKDFISGKSAAQNILLKPGDTIVVP